MKIRINADKIRDAVRSITRRIDDYRIETLSKYSKKTLMIMGSGILALALIGSVVAIAENGEATNQEVTMAAYESETSEPAGYDILIDNIRVATLATLEEAQSVLDGVTDYYLTDEAEIVKVSYLEDVQLTETLEESVSLIPVADAISMIITGTKEPKTYTVQAGDSLWDISMGCDMSVDELIAANPQADPEHLTIGTKLNLYEVKPYLHLTLTEKITAKENIDYEIKYEETSTLYKGELQVKIAGVYGQREVVKEVTKENGAIVSSTELEAQVVSEPQPQVMLKGTKSVSTLVGTGSFTSPMGYLEVSSPYGSRGSGRHTGVDFRNPKGTPIYVVDDGVVVFAAYQGTYGNLVKVSHGNGVETWYAHCDTMQVKIGDVVKKGDQIATVGDTGRATGYHLHFEVRKNGVPQNPMNYL